MTSVPPGKPGPPKCWRCVELEKKAPKGTHTYTVNEVVHTHPDCVQATFRGF